MAEEGFKHGWGGRHRLHCRLGRLSKHGFNNDCLTRSASCNIVRLVSLFGQSWGSRGVRDGKRAHLRTRRWENNPESLVMIHSWGENGFHSV
jgi:hypothetical protein